MSRKIPSNWHSQRHSLRRVLRPALNPTFLVTVCTLIAIYLLLTRRTTLRDISAPQPAKQSPELLLQPSMNAIRQIIPLGRQGPWKTQDPYLFCVHHLDNYPVGNKELAPAKELLRGRHIGSDFSGIDGWSMYHGSNVPGFPQHPHRGFETITFVRSGFIDHSDSLGAAARFGRGDVQWMTAGKGIVHSEMFPLLNQDSPNPCELFQIWINLPAAEKMVEPHFSMLWSEDIPILPFSADGSKMDGNSKTDAPVKITVVAGELHGHKAPPPPPHSWASKPEADVALLHGEMQPGASFSLPPPRTSGAVRTLYVFSGGPLMVGSNDEKIQTSNGGVLESSSESIVLKAGSERVSWLLLQGKPIDEPVQQHGPFVMNTASEIQQAFMDYRRTQFGGWPWQSDDPNHGPTKGRFAHHADGKVEER